MLLVAASTGLRAWAAWHIPAPSIPNDSYSELGQSIDELGLMQVSGGAPRYNLLYPVLVDLPLSLGDRELGYALLKTLQALVMSAAAVPVYLWGREIVGRSWAMAAAATALAGPALVYSGLVMTEVLYYPLLTVAAWACWGALVRTNLGSQLLAIMAIAAVVATRFQGIVLVPAFVTAVLLVAVFERDRRRPLPYWPSFLGLVVIVGAWTVWPLADRSRVSALVGGDLGYGLGEAVLYSRLHLGALVLVSGVVPLWALLLLLTDSLRGREASAQVRAYVAVATSFTVWILSEVAFFASRYVGMLSERGLVSLLPVLILAVPIWVIRGARRPWRQTVPIALAAFLLVTTLSLDTRLSKTAVGNAITLMPLHRLDQDLSGVQLSALLTGGILLVLVLLPARVGWTAAALLFGFLAALSVSSSRILAAEATPSPQLATALTTPAREGVPYSMGPLRTLKANPRYFTIDGKRAVYVTGSHTWPNLVDLGPASPPSAFDFDAYLKKLQGWGHNFVRLWARENFRDDVTGDFGVYNNAPHPYVRSGPGNALDGLPKFDLGRLNQAYFDRLRRRVVAARKTRIYVSVMLFEGYVPQLGGEAWAWNGHPMHLANNINGIDGDLNGDGRGTEVHTLQEPRITRIQEAYVRKVIDTLNDLDNVLYEIGNEIGPYSTRFQYHFIDFIKRYEATKRLRHPVGMTYQWKGGTNETLFASKADWISTKDSPYDPPVHLPTKVVVSDSDHHCGATCVNGDWVWRSFTRGQNPIFMDAWGRFRKATFDDPWQMQARRAMGQTRHYANRANLAALRPRPDLCSTRFCLASEGREYIVYQPASAEDGVPFTLDLSRAAGRTFAVEWLATLTGSQTRAGSVAGRGVVTLTAPFGGSGAVAYLTIR